MTRFRPQATGRRAKPVVACPGEHQPAARVTAPGRGVCPACGGERPIYTSSVRGRDLLAPHTIALVVS